MMSPSAYAAFVLAATVLILLPGPNVALILGTSLAQGRRAGLAVVVGSSSAMVLQLTALGFGLATLMARASHLFAVLRWIGVAYLLVLGLKAFFGRADDLVARRAAPSWSGAFWRGFAVSLTNPKTLLFYGAFLPQFIDPRGSASLQLFWLAVTFLGLAAIFDSGWALMATRLRHLLNLRPRLRNHLTGTCLIGAAAGLVLAHERG